MTICYFEWLDREARLYEARSHVCAVGKHISSIKKTFQYKTAKQVPMVVH